MQGGHLGGGEGGWFGTGLTLGNMALLCLWGCGGGCQGQVGEEGEDEGGLHDGQKVEVRVWMGYLSRSDVKAAQGSKRLE